VIILLLIKKFLNINKFSLIYYYNSVSLGPLNLSLIPLHLIVYFEEHAILLKNNICMNMQYS